MGDVTPALHERTIVWQRAHELVLAVYSYTRQFPRSETYGLVSQLRRAAVSVPANFAEGFSRHSAAEKLRFYNIAEASLNESRYYLRLAHDLGYGPSGPLDALAVEVGRLLHAYGARMLAARSGR
jgi:four helix bundle protein